MNLSTARSEKRAREVGIRKAIGSVRMQLIVQFLSESVLVSFIALFAGLAMVQLALPYFNIIASKKMELPWANPYFWLVVLLFTFITGLISGSYPAFYLSGFQPIKTLKGTFRTGRWASLPRKVLVVVQFTVSIALIIGTVIVYRQIQHAKNRPLGYNRQGLISYDMNTPEIYGHYNALRTDLLASGAVAEVGQSSSPTTEVWSNQIGFEWEGKDPGAVPMFGLIGVTHDFGKTVGWEIVKGRDFSRAHPADSGGMILNEAAVQLAGFKDPIGKRITWNGIPRPIIGVVKNLVMESPYEAIKPTIFVLLYDWASVMTIRLKPGMPVQDALAKVETVMKQYTPGTPFNYTFTDENYAQKFAGEERIGNLASVFACLAIFISCLGLFGLASYVAEQRTKEIGIRKVLGANVLNMWLMLCKDFIALVVVACVLAIPVATYFLSGWLADYTYRTQMSWWIFASTALVALLITLITVSFQAIKAALANPVKSLRTE